MADRIRELAREAHDKLDRILGPKDAKTVFQDISDVTGTVVRMRNELIRRFRANPTQPGVRAMLDRVNALLSLTVSAEEPLQGIHWERMQQCRDKLGEIAERG